MAKYIDAEKLIAEIERRIKSVESCPFIEAEFGAEMRREGKIQTYNEILSFIDSLQQEQQKVDLGADIEMEWDSFNKHLAKYDEESEEVVWLNRFSFEDIAHYFCKLGRNQVLQEIYDGKTKPVDKITAAWLND